MRRSQEVSSSRMQLCPFQGVPDTFQAVIFKEKVEKQTCTAIQYWSRTGAPQGFPCVLILTRKKLLSLQGTPVLIVGILYSLQGIPCENQYTGKSLQSLQGMGLQCCYMIKHNWELKHLNEFHYCSSFFTHFLTSK